MERICPIFVWSACLNEFGADHNQHHLFQPSSCHRWHNVCGFRRQRYASKGAGTTNAGKRVTFNFFFCSWAMRRACVENRETLSFRLGSMGCPLESLECAICQYTRESRMADAWPKKLPTTLQKDINQRVVCFRSSPGYVKQICYCVCFAVIMENLEH